MTLDAQATGALRPLNGETVSKPPCSDKMPLVNGHAEVSSYVRPVEQVGYHEAFRFGGDHLKNNVARVVEQHPGLGRAILDGFATNLGGTVVSYREWALLSIATLTAMGDTSDQLNVYVEGAFRHGATREEVLDVFKHANAFVGAPRSVNAARSTWNLLSTLWPESPQDGYQEHIIRMGDHDTLVRDSHGAGVPIVLVHALSMDGRMWRDVFSQIAATGVRVIAYDLRGHGHARGAPLTRDLEHLCSDLELLLDALRIDKADICGASYGGAVAQYFALDYPDRTRSLSVLATAGKATPVLATRADRAEQDGMDSLVAESIIRWFLTETIAEDTWCVRYARGCVRRARVEDWAAAWRAMARLDCLERLPALKVPVLVLSGRQDASSTTSMMKAIAAACTNTDAQFEEVDPGTHMMVMEMPKPVADKLIAFREKVDGSANVSTT
jgi:3-oxoadipate enol-lactonase